MKRTIVFLIIVAVALAFGFTVLGRSAQIKENESAAVGSLKTIATQQAIFHSCANIDQNANGQGEYGFLAELCGEVVPRRLGGKVPVSPPYISKAFKTGVSRGKGFAEKNGYCFQIWLPGPDRPMSDADCDATEIDPGTQLDPEEDAELIKLQEEHFVVYAWPIRHGKTGSRTFAINEIGEVYSTEAEYSGADVMPKPDAAFRKGEPAFMRKLGDGEGNDGNVWVPAR